MNIDKLNPGTKLIWAVPKDFPDQNRAGAIDPCTVGGKKPHNNSLTLNQTK